MKHIVIYDTTGRIFLQYSGTEIAEPVGIPYIILEDYNNNFNSEDYRRIVSVDVTKNPHEVVYGLTKAEEEKAAMSLDDYKAYKIKESDTLLKAYLETHPMYSTVHNSEGAYYNVTEEKQNRMISNYISYQIELSTNPDAVLKWNETGESCEVWTPEEYMQLSVEIKAYVEPKVAVQQNYEKLVTAATSKEEIDMIVLSYEDSEE